MERKIVLVLDFYLLFSENTICSNNIRVDELMVIVVDESMVMLNVQDALRNS